MDIQFTANIIFFIVLSIILISCCVYLYTNDKNKNNTINIIDLISVDGQLSERKFARFGAWLVSTWGFVFLIANDKLSEWYFIGYIGAWVSNALLGKLIPNNDHKQKGKEENS